VTVLQCEMRKECTSEVTHIGSKGYIYCKGHAQARGGYESARAMRVWELDLVKAGKQVPSYEYKGVQK